MQTQRYGGGWVVEVGTNWPAAEEFCMFLVAFNSIDLCQSLCPSCMEILVLLNIH